MARRKLSKQQQRRIRNRQKALSDSDRKTGRLPDDARRGRVISHHGKQLQVEDPDTGEACRCVAKASLGTVLTGDRVYWRHGAESETGKILAVEDRETVLQRPDPYGRPKAVAANIDQVLIVIAPLPAPNDYLIDRYLVAVETSGIQPVLVVNKADMPEAEEETIQALGERYTSLGYPLLTISAVEAHGLDPLIERLEGHTSVLVGQSGVGKSAIVKALLPDQEIRIREVSQATEEGRHTTRTSTLYHLPHGGDLIDSPGVRDFGLWAVDPQQVEAAFPEFHRLEQRCKFNNCTHRKEPGCAVKRAVEAGEIDPQRYRNYLRMLEEIEGQQTQRRHEDHLPL